jgi:hypothetical protein
LQFLRRPPKHSNEKSIKMLIYAGLPQTLKVSKSQDFWVIVRKSQENVLKNAKSLEKRKKVSESGKFAVAQSIFDC